MKCIQTIDIPLRAVRQSKEQRRQQTYHSYTHTNTHTQTHYTFIQTLTLSSAGTFVTHQWVSSQKNKEEQKKKGKTSQEKKRK